jgi:hypothetical protein
MIIPHQFSKFVTVVHLNLDMTPGHNASVARTTGLLHQLIFSMREAIFNVSERWKG